MSNKKLLVPEARAALENFKMEIAQELGVNQNNLTDYLSSYHTGRITRKLVEIGEKQLVNNQNNNIGL